MVDEPAPAGRKKRLRENALKQLDAVEECMDPSLRLAFALAAQSPILAQDDKAYDDNAETRVR